MPDLDLNSLIQESRENLDTFQEAQEGGLESSKGPTGDLYHQMRAKVSLAVQRAQTGLMGGESVDWLLSSSILPAGPNQMVAVFGLTVAIRSYVLGEKVQGTMMIQNLWTSQDELDQMVPQMISTLLEARNSQRPQQM